MAQHRSQAPHGVLQSHVRSLTLIRETSVNRSYPPAEAIMAVSRSHTFALIAALLLLAACHANVAPTVAQFRAELNALKAVLAKTKEYSAFARGVDNMLKYPDSQLPQLFNTTLLVPTNKAVYGMGIKTLQNTIAMEAIGRFNVLQRQFTAAQLLHLKPNTLLRTKAPPTDLLQRYPSVGANAGKAVLGPRNVTAAVQGVVLATDTTATAAQLLNLKPNTLLRTKAPPSDLLQRYPSVGANAGKAVLGPRNASAAVQGVVLFPDLYTGKFLKAHGLSVFFRPKGY
ncbi:unnamed protein product [Closterium sp. Yama58-4]|nr:unnamed protein product [Closterium sp. Yama58-4]